MSAPARRDTGGRRAHLGKYAKSITPPADRLKIQASRAERYQLLATARGLFIHEGEREGLEHSLNWHRTAKCKWVMHGQAVGIHASCEHAGAFYSGLINCGSVWACPVCSAKVQERRRLEIAEAVAWAYRNGLQPVMVTLTFPHYAWQQLCDLIAQQADALQGLRAGNPWKRFKESVGYQGLIRSLELTLGCHGWHPHTHELWFVSSDVAADLSTPEKRAEEDETRAAKGLPPLPANAQDMRSKILERWRNRCAKVGLLDLANADQVEAFNAHAVDAKGWCDASDYLAKQDDSRNWGVDREMAKASTKQGKAKGKHPFGLLTIASGYADAQDEATRAEAIKAGKQFVEYAQVMKGKRQIFWSHGFKALVGVADLTDEEIVEDERESADLLGLLDVLQWRLVREHGQQAQLLDAAEQGGWSAVLALLSQLALNAPGRRRRGAANVSAEPVP